MVAIKDFGMPSCCGNCEMSCCRRLEAFYCVITLQDVDIDSGERDVDCPLVEVEDGNDD